MFRAVIFSAIALASFSAPAFANDLEINSLRVSYADLDLSREKDAARLLNRINTAAKRVCGDTYGRVSVDERRAQKQCRNETMEKAVASLDQPVVTAEYIERTGRRIAVAAVR